jgi:hypothetical protein
LGQKVEDHGNIIKGDEEPSKVVRKMGKNLEISEGCHVGLAAFQLQKDPTPGRSIAGFAKQTNCDNNRHERAEELMKH